MYTLYAEPALYSPGLQLEPTHGDVRAVPVQRQNRVAVVIPMPSLQSGTPSAGAEAVTVCADAEMVIVAVKAAAMQAAVAIAMTVRRGCDMIETPRRNRV